MSDDVPDFLSRWSRLKRRVSLERGASAKPTTAAPPPEAAVPDSGTPAARGSKPAPAPSPADKPRQDETPVDLAKLPSIESLGKDSDYTVFLRNGVPEELRLKALRRMWLTDPSISGPDLLEMNALDYTGLEGPRPLMTSATKVVAAVAKAVKGALDRAETAPTPEPQNDPATAAPSAEDSEDGDPTHSPSKPT